MSLQIAAQHLASKGRGNDSMLIHMTPREVGGLQALAMAHGGSLTTNPDTGLPEAGFLENLLPTLIGAGLTFFTGGAINPLTAGMITGGVETLRTGDLGKGLMAGLGAYGGAGLGASVAGAGSVGAQAAGQAAAEQSIAQQAAAQGIAPSEVAREMASGFAPQAGADVAKQAAMQDFAKQGIGEQLKGSFGVMGQPGGMSAFGSNVMSQFGGSPTAAAAGAFGVGAPFIPPPKPIGIPEEKSNYEGPYVPSPREVRFRSPEDKSSSEFSYFSPFNPVPGYQPMYMAEGGEAQAPVDSRIAVTPAQADVFRNIAAVQQTAGIPAISIPPTMAVAPRPVTPRPVAAPNITPPNPISTVEQSYGFRPVTSTAPATSSRFGGLFGNLFSRLRGGATNYRYDPTTQQVTPMATGGLTALAGGRFLQGPGDGTSDSIPAVIGNKQPARLADGEFVIDARTVSELGNGSSKAGAQKLYKMMDRVHTARKKAGRGKDSKAEKYLPA